MRWLADTHVFLYWMVEPERLPPGLRAIIAEEPGDLFFSTASLWEIVIKSAIGKLSGIDAGTVIPTVREQGWRVLDIKASHILGVATLPPIHADPFDRLLVAQAIDEGLSLLSCDSKLARYPLTVHWE